MPHGPASRPATRALAATGAALLATGLVAAPGVALGATPTPSTAAATGTITDGCGRVDSISVDVRGTYWLEVLPDGKAATKATPIMIQDDKGRLVPKPLADYTEEDWATSKGYVDFGAGPWTRPLDSSKSYVQVRLLEYVGAGQFRPLPLVLDGSDPSTATRGTETFRITNEDCVVPAAPTFTDEEGSDGDTVTIPEVTGVKYTGKPGTSPGKGTVTVVATPDKGYRFADADGVPIPADQTRWTHTFDGTAPVSIPDDATPTFRQGTALPAVKGKPAARTPNVVVLQNVPGVAWIVDGKPVKGTDKNLFQEVPIDTKTWADVRAVPADPKAYRIEGTARWTVGSQAAGVLRPAVGAPSSLLGLGASTVQWSRPEAFPAGSTYNVRYRVITLTKSGVRAPAPWRPLFQETSRRSTVMKARPGTVVEVQAQAVDGERITGWSTPETVWFPIDIAPRLKAWKTAKTNGAIGNTLATATVPGAAWSVRTPTTNRVALWFGTSPKGAPAQIYVDGKRVATARTAGSAGTRRMLASIPVRWGGHTVTVIHGGTAAQSLSLDGVAFGR